MKLNPPNAHRSQIKICEKRQTRNVQFRFMPNAFRILKPIQGGGWKFLVTEIFFSAKTSSWGLKTLLNFFSEGGDFGVLGAPHAPPGGRAGSENDTLLPMTMTCDRLKFWSGPAWRSKVIIRKPWRRKNKK